MATNEMASAVAGSEARAILYTHLPADTVLAYTRVDKLMDELQEFQPLYTPAPGTYFNYTEGYIAAGLGERASEGAVRYGFVSYADSRAIALAGDMLAFSVDRSKRSLSDFFNAVPQMVTPKIDAIRELLKEPDGLSQADLLERCYGNPWRRRETAYNSFIIQLVESSLAEMAYRRKNHPLGFGTQVKLADQAVADCHEFIGILDRHNQPSSMYIAVGTAKGEYIFSDTNAIRELIAKSFRHSPWAAKYAN